MMDVPPANQSQASSRLWTGRKDWSPVSPQGTWSDPLPDLHQLSLGSPSEQPPTNQQHFCGNSCSYSSQMNNYPGISYGNHIEHCGQPGSSNDPNSSTIQAESQRTMPLYLPPQPYDAQGMPFNYPHGSYQSSPLQHPNDHDYLLQEGHSQCTFPHYPPTSPPSFGHCLNLSPPQASPQGQSDGFTPSHFSPTSYTKQLPQCQLPPYVSGNVSGFAPNAATLDRTMSPQSPTSESRYGLDPELLPSAVKVMTEDKAEWEGKVYASEPFAQLPPLATTSCAVEDRGNASPLAIRSMCYCVPCEGQTALLSCLPLGALVTPLAELKTAENAPPVCKETEYVGGCGGCGAFMCPAMSWQDCGQQFYCPFCGKLSEVSWQHYQPTRGVEGARVDSDRRPELRLGSYEILHSQKEEPAVLLLAIDVSASALRGGHLEFVTQQLQMLLSSLNSDNSDSLAKLRVGLMTYDSRIHLYNLSANLSRPHMMVITEMEDLQLPVREGLLVSLKDCMESVSSVLQLIPQFMAECDEATGVPVELPVKAGMAVLQGMDCPGKLLIFHAAPLVETEYTRSSSGLFGTNKPKSIYQPSELAVSLAKECVRQGCGLHLFVLSQQDVGGAWPGHLPYLTGGALHTYSHLQGEKDKERFCSDLKRIVDMEAAFKAQLRIFVSKDLRVSACYGLFVPGHNPGNVAMATLDKFTTLAVELAYTRALDKKRGVVIQVVLTYSRQAGDRRTKVHTLTLQCSQHLRDAFRNYQAQTLLAFYCKKMYCTVLERPLQDLREELQTEITEALASYRKHGCAASPSDGQLVIPQHLRALPVYMNSLRKSEVLLPGLRSSIHQRLLQRCQVLSMDTHGTVTHFYPLVLPLLLSSNDSQNLQPMMALRCSAASLKPTGLYLLHSPLTLLLWVGNQVPACTLMELFNINCFSSLPSGETKLPLLENSLSIGVRSLIHTLNSQAPCTRQLSVVKQGDTCEEVLQRHLVEDKSPNGGASYADFVYHLYVNSVRLLQ